MEFYIVKINKDQSSGLEALQSLKSINIICLDLYVVIFV